jgi:glycosyltransferase involved in cell wall biosynthesis
MLNSMGRKYIEWLASMGDAVICVSNAQKRLIMQTCGKIFWRKFHVIYNPIPKISYVDVNGDDFGYFGGPNISKGFLVLYNAMKILNGYKRKYVTVHATKFQSFPNKEILGNIGFKLYGKLDEFEYENLYKQIRAVIIPSIWEEPLPYVVVEALMKRRLVIASNVGGINEMVNGCSGTFLFEPNDYEHLSELIGYVNGLDKQEMLELGAKNRETFSKKFSNEKAIMNFIYVLEKIACH